MKTISQIANLLGLLLVVGLVINQWRVNSRLDRLEQNAPPLTADGPRPTPEGVSSGGREWNGSIRSADKQGICVLTLKRVLAGQAAVDQKIVENSYWKSAKSRGYTIVACQVSVQNTGTEDLFLLAVFSLLTASGETISTSHSPRFNTSNVKPNEIISGYLIFDVPVNEPLVSIQFDTRLKNSRGIPYKVQCALDELDILRQPSSSSGSRP